MRGLDPRIHRKNNVYSKVMDCRVKPGNDARWVDAYEGWYNAMDFSALLTPLPAAAAALRAIEHLRAKRSLRVR